MAELQVGHLSRTLTRHIAREDESRQRPLDFRLIARLMSYTRPYAARRNGLLISVVIRSIQLPALTWLLAAVINGPIENRNAQGVLLGAVAFALLALSTQFVMHYRQRLALELGEAVVGDLRNALFAKLQRMPMSWHHRTKVGRIISRMTSDVEDLRSGVQEVLFVTLVQVGQMFVAAAAMLWTDASLFLIVLGLAPVIWIINRVFHQRLSVSLRAMRESFSRVTATLAEAVVGIRVTQAFVRQEENSRIFAELSEDHSRYNTAVLKTHGLFLPLLDLNTQVFMALLLVVGGWRVLAVHEAARPPSTGVVSAASVLEGAVGQGGAPSAAGESLDQASRTPAPRGLDAGRRASSVGDLIGFFFMAGLFFSPISVIGGQFNQAMTAMAGAERLFQLLDMPPEWSDPPDAVDPGPLQGRVQFEHVTFAYEPGRPVLHDICLDVAPGQTVALVGHTGSGKSSLINLVSKFYLASEGELRIDGRDIRTLRSDALHHQMGIVLQQNFLFHGTVADNIRLGKPTATEDEAAAALEQLGAGDLLAALPQGLKTLVGERGGTLSLGQRQLICFARALIADPRILILDEATSSIDSALEARIQAALAVLLRGRTSFVVAHRLSTVRHADLLVVLDHGRIVERGRHAELLAANGVYAQLHNRFVSG